MNLYTNVFPFSFLFINIYLSSRQYHIKYIIHPQLFTTYHVNVPHLCVTCLQATSINLLFMKNCLFEINLHNHLFMIKTMNNLGIFIFYQNFFSEFLKTKPQILLHFVKYNFIFFFKYSYTITFC